MIVRQGNGGGIFRVYEPGRGLAFVHQLVQQPYQLRVGSLVFKISLTICIIVGGGDKVHGEIGNDVKPAPGSSFFFQVVRQTATN